MAAVIDTALPTAITDEYEITDTLGTGHFSKVKLGTHKKTGEKVAVKIIQKPKGSKIAMLKAEVDILTKCDHPNVVKMHACYETDTILYLVLELLTGGELFDNIIAKGHYSEADARTLTVTLLDSIKYLHSQGIAHRDLKPENILLKDANSGVIKVTDFGLSKIFAEDAQAEIVMKTACGTPGYVAPEVLGHETYSAQVDLWSVGVIVYILLCGFPPFYGDNDAQMFRKIKAGSYKFLSPYWDPISADAKDFVAKLLVVDPKVRMTAEQALGHKWLVGKGANVSTKNLFEKAKAPAKEGQEDEDGMDGLRENLMNFNLDRKLAPDRRIKAFGLPEGSERVGKFKCALGNAIGQMYITIDASASPRRGHLCFMGAMGKKLVVPLDDITAVAKAKRFKLSPGSGHSLHITTKGGTKHEFNGISERNACAACIEKACHEAGNTSVTVSDP